MEVANGIFVKGKSFHFCRIQENKGASLRQLSIVRFQRLQKKAFDTGCWWNFCKEEVFSLIVEFIIIIITIMIIFVFIIIIIKLTHSSSSTSRWSLG